MQIFHAFYSELAETKVLGSHTLTPDGRKYTALFNNIEDADGYLCSN